MKLKWWKIWLNLFCWFDCEIFETLIKLANLTRFDQINWIELTGYLIRIIENLIELAKLTRFNQINWIRLTGDAKFDQIKLI